MPFKRGLKQYKFFCAKKASHESFFERFISIPVKLFQKTLSSYEAIDPIQTANQKIDQKNGWVFEIYLGMIFC